MDLNPQLIPPYDGSSLRYITSPLSSEMYACSQYPTLDIERITSAPPALIPSGMIECLPSLERTREYYSVGGTGGMPGMPQPESTPSMHPKLVATLKNFIEPNPSSPLSSGSSALSSGTGASDASGDEFMSMESYLFGGMSGGYQYPVKTEFLSKDLLLPDLHNLSLSPTSGVCRNNTHSEDDAAAVVPLHLIQNLRPFNCEFDGCDRTFKNNQTMRMHHKSHSSGSSSFLLGVSTRGSLNFKAGHNKKIPAKCPACFRTFVGLYELRRHFGRKHTEGERAFGCKKCDKKFHIEVDLRDHQKLCGTLIKCSQCPQSFAFKCNLVAHRKKVRH